MAASRFGGGQMARSSAAARMMVARQIDKCREAGDSGGDGLQRDDRFVQQEHEEQVRVELGSDHVGVFGGQSVDMQDRLEPLERAFDLPAQTRRNQKSRVISKRPSRPPVFAVHGWFLYVVAPTVVVPTLVKLAGVD